MCPADGVTQLSKPLSRTEDCAAGQKSTVLHSRYTLPWPMWPWLVFLARFTSRSIHTARPAAPHNGNPDPTEDSSRHGSLEHSSFEIHTIARSAGSMSHSVTAAASAVAVLQVPARGPVCSASMKRKFLLPRTPASSRLWIRVVEPPPRRATNGARSHS